MKKKEIISNGIAVFLIISFVLVVSSFPGCRCGRLKIRKKPKNRLTAVSTVSVQQIDFKFFIK